MRFYFIFYIWDAVYYSIMPFLFLNKETLRKNNIIYSPFFSSWQQLWSHDELFLQANNYIKSCKKLQNDLQKTYKDKIINYIQSFKKNLELNKHILYTSAIPSPATIEHLLQQFNTIKQLNNLEKHAIFLLGRQDGELQTCLFRYWRSLSTSQLVARLLPERERLDESYDYLSATFGVSNCHVLTYQTDHPWKAPAGLLDQLCDLLELPPASLDGQQQALPSYPRTFPGLDMLCATYDFPFSFREKLVWDRHAFYATLRHVEKNEGYPDANFLPQPETEQLLQACQPGNARLAQMLGKDTLFPSPSPLDTLPPLPPDIPYMTSAQCRAFVSALEPEFRAALLRFFRDKDALHPTELILARQLEDFRRRLFSANAFSWPRKSAPVAVLTLCWNQEKYITQCMESVAEQRCPVPVDHIIVDDNSDDASASRIDDFASRHAHVHPIYLRAQAGHGENVRALFSHCKSHYAALCDGDDYFTDPHKLQKQLDFLQRNKNCALCFHPVRLVYEDGSPSRLYPPADMLPGGVKQFYTLRDLLTANMIQTNSVMYRWRFREGLPSWFDPTLIPGDWYWHLLHAEHGSIGYQQDPMSVYRRHAASFFAASEKDHVRHRVVYGLNELRLYAAVERHFKGKFHAQLSRLATGVFSDLVMHYLTNGDDALLRQGIATCPEFGKEFMEKLSQTASRSA